MFFHTFILNSLSHISHHSYIMELPFVKGNKSRLVNFKKRKSPPPPFLPFLWWGSPLSSPRTQTHFSAIKFVHTQNPRGRRRRRKGLESKLFGREEGEGSRRPPGSLPRAWLPPRKQISWHYYTTRLAWSSKGDKASALKKPKVHVLQLLQILCACICCCPLLLYSISILLLCSSCAFVSKSLSSLPICRCTLNVATYQVYVKPCSCLFVAKFVPACCL